MSLPLLIWATLWVILAVLALSRPIWAVGLYMLNYFAHPSFWDWGSVVPPTYRWSLYSAWILLFAILLGNAGVPERRDEWQRRTLILAVLIVLNATFVHMALAPIWDVSMIPYVNLVKFVLLVFLIDAAVQTPKDFMRLMVMITLGLGYWGFESLFGSHPLIQGRLEDLGGPGSVGSNELASFVVTLLPLVGGLLFVSRGWTRILVALVAISGVNLVLLCNSRGGLLALVASAGVLTGTGLSMEGLRKKVLGGLALGAMALFLLLGDARIMERFLTTFVDPQERDASITSRIDAWKSGVAMVGDYPLGSGGDAFRKIRGADYLPKDFGLLGERSVHSGFINEACMWGIQGLILRVAFLGCAIMCAYRTMVFRRNLGDTNVALFGVCLLAGMTGLLVTSAFNDLLELEWGYWIVAFCVLYAKIFGPESRKSESDVEALEQGAAGPTEEHELQLAGGLTR